MCWMSSSFEMNRAPHWMSADVPADACKKEMTVCIYSVKSIHNPSAYGYSKHYGFLLCALVSLDKFPVPVSSRSPQKPLITYRVLKKKRRKRKK